MTQAPARLAYGFAKSRGIVFRSGERPAFVLKRGGDRLALLEARRAIGRAYPVEEVDAPQFDRALSDIYAFSGADAGSLGDQAEGESLSSIIDDIPPAADLLDSASDAPIIRLINGLIAEAIRTAASDIHVEPYEDRVSVRYRIDGVLSERASLAPALASPLVSRIKVMSRLDIAEKRIPQDGRLTLTLGGKGVDVRVATLPSRFGERVVLRLLDKDQARFTLDQLGMGPNNLAAMKKALGPAQWHHPGHRADRSRQDDHAVCRAEPSQRCVAQYSDGRGSGGICARRCRTDTGQCEGRHDICHGVAGDSPTGPRRGHGGRDS